MLNPLALSFIGQPVNAGLAHIDFHSRQSSPDKRVARRDFMGIKALSIKSGVQPGEHLALGGSEAHGLILVPTPAIAKAPLVGEFE